MEEPEPLISVDIGALRGPVNQVHKKVLVCDEIPSLRASTMPEQAGKNSGHLARSQQGTCGMLP